MNKNILRLAAGPLALIGFPLLAACATTGAADDGYAGADSSIEEGAADSPTAKVVVGFTEVDLVSDRDGAITKDPNLTNPWGIAFNPAGPAWVANNHSGTSTVYDTVGALKLTVTMPEVTAGDAAPLTGQVFNAVATDFLGDKFIFNGEDGRFYAWQPATGTTMRFDNSAAGAAYKGLAIATNSDGKQLIYGADFANAKVTVLDASYAPVTLDGDFRDPKIPAGYAPFNTQNIEGKIVVAFAKQNADGDDEHGAGNGYVDMFDTEGHFERRLVTRGSLNSPWALAVAPAPWGSLAGTLLVGNQGNGHVHAYDSHAPASYGKEKVVSKGTLAIGSKYLALDGLWALTVGPDNQVYFTAGPNHEANGLFGRLAR
ncbi:hypothetical protein BH11MYX1_BH11MYX1_53500 [soil metagenome]